MSVKLMMILSTAPPKYPDTSPSTTPTAVEMAVAISPTSRETRVAYSRRLNTSRPIWSVPSRCWALGGWEKAVETLVGG